MRTVLIYTIFNCMHLHSIWTIQYSHTFNKVAPGVKKTPLLTSAGGATYTCFFTSIAALRPLPNTQEISRQAQFHALLVRCHTLMPVRQKDILSKRGMWMLQTSSRPCIFTRCSSKFIQKAREVVDTCSPQHDTNCRVCYIELVYGEGFLISHSARNEHRYVLVA